MSIIIIKGSKEEENKIIIIETFQRISLEDMLTKILEEDNLMNKILPTILN
jgi:hypothetical protein